MRTGSSFITSSIPAPGLCSRRVYPGKVIDQCCQSGLIDCGTRLIGHKPDDLPRLPLIRILQAIVVAKQVWHAIVEYAQLT